MTPLPAPLDGSALVAWRLDQARHAATWDSGEGAHLVGGRWNTRGVRAVYCSIDPATAILLEQFPNQSRRTRTRVARAIQLAALIRDYFNVEGVLEDAIRHATRPNGSLNATLVLAHVEKRMAMLVASRSAAC